MRNKLGSVAAWKVDHQLSNQYLQYHESTPFKLLEPKEKIAKVS